MLESEIYCSLKQVVVVWLYSSDSLSKGLIRQISLLNTVGHCDMVESGLIWSATDITDI